MPIRLMTRNVAGVQSQPNIGVHSGTNAWRPGTSSRPERSQLLGMSGLLGFILQDEADSLTQVGRGALGRLLRIVIHDGLEDLLMVLEQRRVIGRIAARQVRRLVVKAPQQAGHEQKRLVAGRRGYGRVEVKARLDAGLTVADRCPAAGDRLTDALDVVGGRALGGESYHRGLENEPRLDDIGNGTRVREARPFGQHEERGSVHQYRPASARRFDYAQQLEHAKSLTQRRAADSPAFGQLALAREAIADLDPAVGHEADKLVDNDGRQ